MSSVSTTAITSDSKQRYQIDFKILAIDLKEEDEHKDNLSITVRFADKCFTIKPGDVSEDEGRSRGESSRSTKSSRSSSRSSKKSDNLPSRGSVNDANDEFSNVSGARSKESRKSKTRKSENCKDTSQAPGNVSIFGSKTICYESSPTSLSEKMANHCIKYEILNCGHLIGMNLNSCPSSPESFSFIHSNDQSIVERLFRQIDPY